MELKKYIQICLILGLFFILVQVKNSTASPSSLKLRVGPIPTKGAPPKSKNHALYKDGTYKGSVEDAHYGLVQVEAEIKDGNIVSVNFLQYPNDNNTSRYINESAIPILSEEALHAQSSQVDIVTGASHSSKAFRKSLATALSSAR